jgi:hypothetical protein
MYVLIAKFDCLWHQGMPKTKKNRSMFGLLQSLRKNLQCSVQCVDGAEEGAAPDFAIGVSFVLPEKVADVETQFSNTVVELIERKGEAEVHDYVCTVVDVDEYMSQEDLVTVH